MDILSNIPRQVIRGPADFMNLMGRNEITSRRCGDMEMDALECLNAYGLTRGQKVCQTYVNDFKECALAAMQVSF